MRWRALQGREGSCVPQTCTTPKIDEIPLSCSEVLETRSEMVDPKRRNKATTEADRLGLESGASQHTRREQVKGRVGMWNAFPT